MHTIQNIPVTASFLALRTVSMASLAIVLLHCGLADQKKPLGNVAPKKVSSSSSLENYLQI